MRRFVQDKGRTKKQNVWEIERDKNSIVIVWGQRDGAMQQTIQTFEALNVGKANEKTGEEVAQEALEREIKKKDRQGYREVNKRWEYLEGESSESIDFSNLPLNLRFFKPQNSLNAYLLKLIEKRVALLLRKRDGLMHALVIDKDRNPHLYSSNMLREHKNEPGVPWLERHLELSKEIYQLQFPPNTILLGELCTTSLVEQYREDTGLVKDDFIYVCRVVKSLKSASLELQKEYGPLGFCIWDVAYWDDVCFLEGMAAADRFFHIRQFLANQNAKYISFPEILTLTEKGFHEYSFDLKRTVAYDCIFDNEEEYLKNLTGHAKSQGWEGYVVVDPNATYGDRSFSFHGKAERPKEVGKLKPTLEADFIVRWDPDNGIGEWGKGKKSGGVGSVMAYLWDPDAQEEVPVCKVGGGLTDALVHTLNNKDLYPMVWQIEFSEWTNKGALRFPEFVRIREDKSYEECSIYQKPAKEDEEG